MGSPMAAAAPRDMNELVPPLADTGGQRAAQAAQVTNAGEGAVSETQDKRS